MTHKQTPRLNIRVPRWLVWVYWIIVGIFILPAIAWFIPNSSFGKMIDMWIERILKSIFTSIITLLAFVMMIMPHTASSATPTHHERSVMRDAASSPRAQTTGKDPWSYRLDHADTLSYSSPLRDTQIDASVSVPELRTIPVTNIVSWYTNDGIVYVTTAEGVTYPTQNLGLCAALIFGGIVIVVAGIGGCKIYKCAKNLLGTNQPPTTNAPPSSTNANSSLTLNMPAGVTVTMANTSDSIAVSQIAHTEWRDWQNHPIRWQFGMTVHPTNLVVGTNFCHIQSSTNLSDPLAWTSESFSVTGWVSSASVAAPDTNALVVTYDQYGIPFMTNWYSLQITNGDYATVPIGSMTGIPRRSSPQLFFRTEIKP